MQTTTRISLAPVKRLTPTRVIREDRAAQLAVNLRVRAVL
jgi:hypothetical protein